MSKKGKHSKEKENKFKIHYKILIIIVSILVIVGGIILCTIAINNKNDKNKESEKNIEAGMEESIETSATEMAEIEEIEEPIIEETVDTNIEVRINEIMTKNNLDENNFFFFFYNLEEKKYYFYNENTYFTAASAIKVPVAMLYYDKIEAGEITLSDTLLYHSDDYEAGGGSTAASYKVGERIPLSYLLEQTIVNSDNTALNILIGNIGYRKCKEELTKYSDIELPEDFYTSNIANVSYYYDVLQYLYQNTEKYRELISYMKKSSGGIYLKANLPQYEVAHKYGSYDGYVHDYGIIYGKNTYLVGVFTKGIQNASDLIADIGKQVVECAESETPTTENTNIVSSEEKNQTEEINKTDEDNVANEIQTGE